MLRAAVLPRPPLPRLLLLAGTGAAVAAAVAPAAAAGAAGQVWPAFVLVAGLLLVGLVVETDGLFAAAGAALARSARRGSVLFAGSALLVAAVTAVLNLDTSVAFLTPVLVHTARSRGERAAPYLYACLLLSNAGSLLLPGSNLTNLIVVSGLPSGGGAFLARMAAPFVVAVVVTAAVVGLGYRRQLAGQSSDPTPAPRPRVGLGLAALVVTVVLVVAAPQPALPVFGVGAAATVARLARGRVGRARLLDTLQAPTLVGLFGIAVAFGALGRRWAAPATLLHAANAWVTAAVAAGTSLLVNNLPAAALLGAHRPAHPYALLAGLDLGPNVFVTGSLAWLLWLRAARAAGGRPSIRVAARMGGVATLLALPAVVAVLTA